MMEKYCKYAGGDCPRWDAIENALMGCIVFLEENDG